MAEHRYQLARERAGLSLGNAARILNLPAVSLKALECDASQAPDDLIRAMADRYGVNVAWLTGKVPRCDYDSARKIAGFDNLECFKDRDVIAEMLASRPRQGD